MAVRIPKNDEAEMGVIGAALRYEDVLPDVLAVLPRPGSFFLPGANDAWAAVVDLFSAGEPVSALAVSDWLSRSNAAPPEGGWDGFLAAACEAIPGGANAVYFAQIVREKASLRDAMDVGDWIVREVSENRRHSVQIVADAIDRLRGVESRGATRTERLADLIPRVTNRLLDRQGGRSSGVRTPWGMLNFLTDGLQPQDLVVVAARPGMGKTSFALNLADFAATDQGTPALVVSLEMGNPLLAERLLIARSGVDGRRARTGRLQDGDWREIERATAELRDSPLWMVRRPGRSLLEIVAECRRAHARHGVRLILIDYVQLLHGDNPRDTEVQAITKVTGALKQLANELEIPVVALSQLNRAIENRDDKRPRLADLRGSGSIEQDADVIVFLYRPDAYDPNEQPGVAEVVVAKNRNGAPGEFKLRFRNNLMRFEDAPDVVPAPDGEDAPF